MLTRVIKERAEATGKSEMSGGINGRKLTTKSIGCGQKNYDGLVIEHAKDALHRDCMYVEAANSRPC